MPTKRALIVGINKYLFMAEKYQLGGCVNDAKLIRNLLVTKFNFDPANIVALYDEAATRDAVLGEMARLVDVVERDDIVVFHYAGHGHRCKVTTQYTDEGSGKDNCILLTDDGESTADGKRYRDIRDYQIAAWLRQVAAKTRYTTLIFDACHSGTMTRSSATGTQVRSVPTQSRPPAPEVFRGTPASAQRAAATRSAHGGGWLTASNNYVVISGCRDTQTSKEKYFARDGQRIKHGVLSFNLGNALMRAKPGMTYRDVFEVASSGVVAEVDAQNPQVEGAIDRELFGVKDIEPLRFIPLSAINGDQVTLDGGAAQGLRRGSKWAIYPPGAKQGNQNERIGELLVEQVGAVTSTGVIVAASATPLVGARCMEVEPVRSTEPLAVDLSDLPAQARPAIEPGIAQSALLCVAESPATADVQATIVKSAQALPDSTPNQLRRTVAGPSWALFEDGALCMPLHTVDEPKVGTVLLENLEKIARFRNVLKLDNADSTLKVAFNLYRRTPDNTLELANGGSAEFLEREPMVLEITNHEPNKPVFFSLIWISANRQIGHFYPHRKASEELSPGRTVRIGHGNRKLDASLGDDFPLDVGTETCKAIFSTQQSDFSWLNQASLRSGGGTGSNVPAFDAANAGVAAPSAGQHSGEGTPPTADWQAINRSFVLSRAEADQ